MLTKSNYLSAHQCKKRIWLEKKSDLPQASLSRSELKRIEEGNKVGDFARRARGEGVLIEGLDWNLAVSKTREAIEDGANRIFEGAFCFGNYGVRLDIIERVDGGWSLLEVKASTSLKPEHIPDIAFQKYVAEQSGLQIKQSSIMLLNKSYTKGGGEELFIYKNVDEEIRDYMLGLEGELVEINKVLLVDKCPSIHVSSHCKKPDKCSFYEHCWKDIPKKSIFSIPRLSAKKEGELIADGIIAVKDIPDDFELSKNQERYVQSVITEKPLINSQGIKGKLDELSYPIYFFDVESHQVAVPELSGVAPYSQICFQFSCHVLEENGELKHFEFLQVDSADPRKPFLDRLFNVIGDKGSIIIYNQQFEIGRFKELALWHPEYKVRLEHLIARVWDQMIIFKDYYMHPDFNGSISIKSVLPVLVPSLSYKELEISQGDEASAIWSEMVKMEEGSEKDRIVRALKEYCKLDTLAMVEIHKVLGRI